MAHPDEDLANLGSFLEHSAASHPGHPAIRLDDFVLSYAELREAAGRMSTLLAAAGVAPGLDLLPRGQRREEDARTCRPAMHGPGGRRNSEHAAEYPDASAPLLLPLLHDFPDPGRSHRFPCSSPPRTHHEERLTCRCCHGQASARVMWSLFSQVKIIGFKSAPGCGTVTAIVGQPGIADSARRARAECRGQWKALGGCAAA